MNALRVVIAEDDVLYRNGVASLLEHNGFDIVGLAGDGADLRSAVLSQLPDLVICDIRMPPSHTNEGMQAVRDIRRDAPSTGVLVLSAHLETELALEIVAQGKGLGYLIKSRVAEVADFVDALHQIARGGAVVDPGVVQELVNTRRRNDPLAVLSTREREVLGLLAEGRSNTGIGRRLWITESTVEKHVRNVMTKLGLPDTEDDHRRVLAAITFLGGR